MSIAVTNKAVNATDTPGTSFSLDSVAYQNNRLYLVGISLRTQTATITGITGGGLNWVQIGVATSSNGVHYLFRGMVASGASTAALAITCNTGTAAHWTIDEFTGMDTGGTDGSTAIVQSNTNTATASSLAITLSAFADAVNNVAYAFFGHAGETNAIVKDSAPYTLVQTNVVTSPLHSAGSEWATGQDTSVSASWPTSGSSGGVAVEIKVAATGGPFTVTVNRADESDSAFTVAGKKARAVGLAAESDTAFQVKASHVKALGLAAESDTAFSIKASKSRAVGLASESDTAFSIAASKSGGAHTLIVGMAVELDTAFAIIGRTTPRRVTEPGGTQWVSASWAHEVRGKRGRNRTPSPFTPRRGW